MIPAMAKKDISEYSIRIIHHLVNQTHLRAKLLGQLGHLYGLSPVSVQRNEIEFTSLFWGNNESNPMVTYEPIYDGLDAPF